MLAACAGGSNELGLISTAGNNAADSYNPAGYDPLRSADEIVPLREALTHIAPLTQGEFRVWALTADNTLDHDAAGALELSATPGELTISATRPLPAAVLYVGYDASALHPRELDATRADGLGFTLAVEPGLVAVTSAAYDSDAGLATDVPLARLSFDAGPGQPVRAAAAISTNFRSRSRDLTAVDNANSTATLQWHEWHNGDYDNNSEVNGADLTPIAAFFGQSIDTGTDLEKARKDLIDGDENGEINASDITPIAGSFLSFITGYNVYRTPLASADEVPDVEEAGRWELVQNLAEPEGPSAPRDRPAGFLTRLPYTFLDDSGDGNFAWYVVARGRTGETPLEGVKSDFTSVTVTPAGAPPAGLSFEIQDPDDEFMDINDEIWIAVRVTEVEGLFSANVRFEYDSSLLEFIEGQPAYTDVLTVEHPNFLEPPLFIDADDVDPADPPFTLLGFNATQTSGTPAKTGDGNLGYFKFRAIGAGITTEALRFPQASNFIYLWGETYGEDAATPALGSPQNLNIQ